ncbi:hypothetical protein [Flaviflagellibacter deserti]|uniref:Anti-sigma factor n=1 Tax=Flaviflagellibacter deserti TaxID=2267266 RepID=A0ABV9Z3R7_9HYPH
MTKLEDKAEISLLLPWYAAGTLSEAENRRVAAAIEADPELARRFEDVRLEASENLLLNESLGAPSRSAADKLFAAIDAEEAANPRAYKPKFSLSAWLSEIKAALSPKTLGFAAAAAIAIIAVQTGVIVSERSGGAVYETATAPASLSEGRQVLVSFKPQATVGEIDALLRDVGGTIIEAPFEGGLYKVRIGPADLDQAGFDRVIDTMRQRPAVSFVAPASPAS